MGPEGRFDWAGKARCKINASSCRRFRCCSAITFSRALIRNRDANVKETHDLIASDKVEGTKVYDPNGEHIGSIERILVEKRSGQVSYAVLSFGGFLGMGHEHYPLPWSKLNYDESLGGYRVDVTKDQLEGAPKYDNDDDFWTAENGRRVYDYYGVAPYWI